MTGDWATESSAETARFPRATLELDDGSKVVLDDPRALSTLTLHRRGEDPVAGLGPDADDLTLGASWLAARIGQRRTPIKVLLLDQRLLAGIGNIYAAEALWKSRIDPRRPANSLEAPEIRRLLQGIRSVLAKAGGSRYRAEAGRFAVYGRAGEPCRRCGYRIRRITQAGRSTFYCPDCQR
jgi:formamidopyrimidine-DNA glycosylase